MRSLLIGLACVVVVTALALCGDKPTPPPPAEIPKSAPAAPRFWKGNLHTHTLWSDGDDFPEVVADWYKRHDYHFLALTDHNVLSDGDRWIDAGPRAQAIRGYADRFGSHWLERRQEKEKEQIRLKPLREFRSLLEEPGRFLLIPAEEITHKYGKAPVHLNAFNLRDVITPADSDSIAETVRAHLRAVAEQSRKTGWRTTAALNHPNFGWGVRAEDMAGVDELRFFEVYNGHPGVRNAGDDLHASCERIWDIVLALRLGKLRAGLVFGLATDDAHHYQETSPTKSNPGRGWVMVRARHLSAESIVQSLEAGDFYATTGVILDDVVRDGKELRVEIHVEAGVRYKTQFIATLQATSLTSEPRADTDGKPLPVTRVYGPGVGEVVAEVEGPKAVYTLTGKELYVRAKVTSTKPQANATVKGETEVAWTQPIVP